MEKPFSAYSGTEDFVFVCYSHSNADKVYTDLVQLKEAGINLWYDEGIPAGTAWRGEIANAIKNASKLIYFISTSSLKSNHCLREVDYALSHDIEILPVYLENVSLPPELDLVLGRVQGLYRDKDARYMERLVVAVTGGAGFFSPAAKSRIRNSQLVIPGLLISIVLLFGIIWMQNDSNESEAQGLSGINVQPGAFDLYLAGMEQMERWDKDDNLERAIENFSLAASFDPAFALAFARKGEALRMQYLLTGDEALLGEAILNVDEAVSLNSGLAPVQIALGRLHATQGNMDLAFAALEQAIVIDPNDATANAAIARLYERLGRLEEAESYFQKSIALEPENLLNLDSYANFLFRRSRFNDAIVQWQQVIRLAPDHYSALVNLGSALTDSGRIAEGITMFQRALEIQPTYMGYSNLGTSTGRAKRYEEAIDAFQHALEIDGMDWLAWGNLAFVYSWMNGMDQQATETFENAIQLAESARIQSPRDPFVYSDLALYYAKTGQRDLALQRLEAAITLSPDSSEIQAAAAEVNELLGDREQAIEMFRGAIEKDYPVQRFLSNPEFQEFLDDPEVQEIL